MKLLRYLLILKIPSVTLFRERTATIFDPENAFRRPPVILKVVLEAGYDVYTRDQ